jgi:hypothetical protein
MLGGRFAVIREPHFMLGVTPEGTAEAVSRPAGKHALAAVNLADESPHET